MIAVLHKSGRHAEYPYRVVLPAAPVPGDRIEADGVDRRTAVASQENERRERQDRARAEVLDYLGDAAAITPDELEQLRREWA